MSTGTIHVFSTTDKMPRALAAAIHGNWPVQLHGDISRWPLATDYYVTTAELTAKVARAAGFRNAKWTVNLRPPTGKKSAKETTGLDTPPDSQLEWLRDQLEARHDNGLDSWVFVARRVGDTGEPS